MVAFLLDNALGAWWVGKIAGLKDGKELRTGARQILKTAETEDELREFFSLPGVPLEYLRFVKVPSPQAAEDQGEGEEWRPAAGTFDGWPESLKELKTLDPCCGSGHFLVSVFMMLVAMRMELENLSAKDSVDAVLRENIHGLELDQRCVELAAFALALTAWKYPDSGGYRVLPELNVACSGLTISTKKEVWLALAGDNINLRIVLEKLYKQFEDAPMLGSLINPEVSLGKGSLFEMKWEHVGPLLAMALADDKNDETSELGVVALGLSKAAQLLAENYHLVATNVPFKNSGAMSDRWKTFVNHHFKQTNKELASVFIERIMSLLHKSCVAVIVAPQGLLYKDYHSKFRKWLLASE
jgi:hypothetical protein